jgi:hypothetical protein
MKLMLHPVVTAVGASFLCCLMLIAPLVASDHSWIYHDSNAPALVILPLLFNIAVIWLLFTLLLLLAGKPGRIRVSVWSGLILFAPWMLLKQMGPLLGRPFPHRLMVVLFLASCMCWIAAVGLWRPSWLSVFERVQHFSVRMFAVAAILAFVGLGQLMGCLWDARAMQLPRALHSTSGTSFGALVGAHEPRPRVIWIILDELSYEQVYGHRFASLDLPAFDQLAAQSTEFTHVVPAANYTEDAVPSMMAGVPVDHIRLGGDGALRSLHNPVTGQWQPFQPWDTVFGDAVGHGYGTAIAGWYNPYCRILAEVLDHCRWFCREYLGEGMRSDNSLLSNIAAPWAGVLNRNRLLRFDNSANVTLAAENHIADYLDLSSAGDRFLEDPSVGFLLLHIPVPHPGGIYDRRTMTFTTQHASYIDNLALADRYLGHVRELLERRGEWDSSAIVVMGDHSWRTTLVWRGSPAWTPEEEVASRGGQFDDRPAYIVKLPHQEEAAKIDSPFAAVRTRALLDGLLDGSIRSSAELARFAGGAGPARASTQVGGGGLRSRGR